MSWFCEKWEADMWKMYFLIHAGVHQQEAWLPSENHPNPAASLSQVVPSQCGNGDSFVICHLPYDTVCPHMSPHPIFHLQQCAKMTGGQMGTVWQIWHLKLSIRSDWRATSIFIRQSIVIIVIIIIVIIVIEWHNWHNDMSDIIVIT